MLGKIVTVDNLTKKGFYLTNVSLMCYKSSESISHLLIHCPYAWEVWSWMPRDFGMIWVYSMDLVHLLFWLRIAAFAIQHRREEDSEVSSGCHLLVVV